MAYRKKTTWVEGFQLDKLEPESKKYKYIQSKIKKTNGGKDFDIKQIFKIKNSTTWKNYTTAREKIFNDTGRTSYVNEMRLFHGSPYAEDIAKDGFLDSKSQAGGHYFSDLSSYSDGYARKMGSLGSGTTFKMLICLVAMGKMDNSGGRGPVAGCHSYKSGNEFIIYDEKQAFPSYLVEYC